MFDFQAGYRAMQGVMGVRHSGDPTDFKSNWLVRQFRKRVLLPWLDRRSSWALSDRAACAHCGEIGCVEEGPCGGAMCMVHCHACGRDYYGDSDYRGISEHYGHKPSAYYGNRLANRTFVDPPGMREATPHEIQEHTT
jgi:hypothetical protein